MRHYPNIGEKENNGIGKHRASSRREWNLCSMKGLLQRGGVVVGRKKEEAG
jgi:hypothetical protein